MKSPISQKPVRKSLRLKHFDYSQNAYYFITICTKNKQNFFGEIKEDQIILNDYGEIIKRRWLWLADNFDYVELDEFVVMPNHFHGILIINDKDQCRDNPRVVRTEFDIYNRRHSKLSKVICAFKTTSSKQIHQALLPQFSWHRSFYDHIIRDEKKLNIIREYILNNPIKLAIYKGLL